MKTLRLLWFLALAGVCTLGQAGSPLEAGAEVELKGNEGLLLVALNSNLPLASVHLRKVSDQRAADVIKNLSAGRTHYFLYQLEAGEYDLTELYPDHKANNRVSRPPLDEARIRVEPGRINYPGTLVARFSDLVTTAGYHRHNRASQAMLWMKSSFPAVYGRVEFAYSGEVPDGFPAFFQSLSESSEGQP